MPPPIGAPTCVSVATRCFTRGAETRYVEWDRLASRRAGSCDRYRPYEADLESSAQPTPVTTSRPCGAQAAPCSRRRPRRARSSGRCRFGAGERRWRLEIARWPSGCERQAQELGCRPHTTRGRLASRRRRGNASARRCNAARYESFGARAGAPSTAAASSNACGRSATSCVAESTPCDAAASCSGVCTRRVAAKLGSSPRWTSAGGDTATRAKARAHAAAAFTSREGAGARSCGTRDAGAVCARASRCSGE